MNLRPDDVIIARALENGWRQVRDEPLFHTKRWHGWYLGDGRSGHGIPTLRDGEQPVINSDGVQLGKTWAGAIRDRFDHDDRCEECGKWVEYGYFGLVAPARFCHSCAFWIARVRDYGRNPKVLVAGTRLGRPRDADRLPTYLTVGPSGLRRSGNGCGGAWFVITYLDDRPPVETCDLWVGGVVPERFRDRLPINATIEYGRLVKP